MSQCTAVSKRTGERCQAQAIKGKDKCYYHGGATPLKADGSCSKYKDQIFAERREQLEASEDLLSIEPQIALLKAMQEKFLEDLSATGTVGEKETQRILSLASEIVKSIEKVKRLEQEASVPKAIELVVERLVSVINVHVHDTGIREALRADIARAALPEA